MRFTALSFFVTAIALACAAPLPRESLGSVPLISRGVTAGVAKTFDLVMQKALPGIFVKKGFQAVAEGKTFGTMSSLVVNELVAAAQSGNTQAAKALKTMAQKFETQIQEAASQGKSSPLNALPLYEKQVYGKLATDLDYFTPKSSLGQIKDAFLGKTTQNKGQYGIISRDVPANSRRHRWEDTLEDAASIGTIAADALPFAG